MGTLIKNKRLQRAEPVTAQGEIISGVRKQTRSELGCVLYQVRINGEIYSAFQWDPAGQVLEPLAPGTQAKLIGVWNGVPRRSNIQLRAINTLECRTLTPLEAVLNQSPRQDLTAKLVMWLDRLHPPLKQFVTDVLSEPSIGVPFVTLPASVSHHHPEPGGLLDHSCECVMICGKAVHATLSRQELHITMVAALLHDIGKIRTYTDTVRLSDTGQTVPHEVLTLEILSPYLARLDQTWGMGANVLRSILTWDLSKSRFPMFPGTLLVKSADQFSTAMSCRNKVFSSRPGHHWKACSDGAQKQSFLRIPD